jgi:hypothetical protein
MGQFKSKDQDFKSYANTVFRCGAFVYLQV